MNFSCTPALEKDSFSRRFKSERGFTILEVAMATFVMALGISTAIIAMQTGFKTLDVSRGTTLASQVLQSEMETLRLSSWGSLPATGNIDLTAVFTTDPTLASRFTATRTVSPTPGYDNMRDITLTVSWTTIDGRSLTRKFFSRYCKDGLYDYYYTVAGS